MNVSTRKILTICSPFLVIFLLNSCTDIFSTGNSDSINGNFGKVTVILDPLDQDTENSFSFPVSKTMMPQTNDGKYVLKFTNLHEGLEETIVLPITNSVSTSHVQELPPGDWTLDVTRYQARGTPAIDYIVAKGSADINDLKNLKAGDIRFVTIDMVPIDGDTGIFVYTIKSDLIADGNLILKSVIPGNELTIPISITTGSAGGSVNLSPGFYDVFVSLLSQDNRGAGMYSAARIYSGLETTTLVEVTPGNLTEYFNFSANHFVQSINLAGTLNVVNSYGIPVGTVIITAHNPSGGAQVGSSYTYTTWPDTGKWTITGIPPQYRSVDLTVTINSSDDIVDITYKTEKALTLYNIPDQGSPNVSLSAGIYKIDTGTWPSGNSIGAQVGVEPRNYASPGEQVDLAIHSTYGLRQGSLKVLSGSQQIPVTGSGSSYSFKMPQMPGTDVSLSGAQFYTLNLNINSLISSSRGNEVLTHVLDDNYSLIVPNDIATIFVSAVPAENETTVSIDSVAGNNHSYNLSSLTPAYITVRVQAPSGTGGIYSYREYSITVTRAKSANCYLNSLTVNGNSVPSFDANNISYNISVPYSPGTLAIVPTAADSKATVKIYQNDSELLDWNNIPVSVVGLNDPIEVIVTAEDGVTDKTYTINVTRQKNSDANLLNLVLKNDGSTIGYTPSPFSQATTFYQVTVPYAIYTIDVIATAVDSSAAVTVSSAGINYANGVDIPLVAGSNNVISVNVTAGNDIDSKTYTILVIRDAPTAADATLKSMVLNGGTLYDSTGTTIITFDPMVTGYMIKLNGELSIGISVEPKYPLLAKILVLVNGSIADITDLENIDVTNPGIYPVNIIISVILEEGKQEEKRKDYILEIVQGP